MPCPSSHQLAKKQELCTLGYSVPRNRPPDSLQGGGAFLLDRWGYLLVGEEPLTQLGHGHFGVEGHTNLVGQLVQLVRRPVLELLGGNGDGGEGQSSGLGLLVGGVAGSGRCGDLLFDVREELLGLLAQP